ncbi:MAG: dTDP-4-dehydrorhamnose reductase [Candidatus Nanopelagicales bacterium]
MTRWLVLGARGQLGSDVMARLGSTATGLDYPDVDITDPSSVRAAVSDTDPHIVVNCAAYTAVDAAETDEAAAEAVNGHGPRVIALACRRARLIHVSTDYVFDGTATEPYPEDATPNPRSAYGRSKLHGEQAVLSVLPQTGFVVRTAWLYGAGGNNFVKTMLGLESTRETLTVVDDQIGQPTWSRDLAAQIIALGQSAAPPGIYHGTNSGSTSWYGLTCKIFDLLGADPHRVQPTTTEAFPRPAPRPAFSALGHARWANAGLPTMRPWDQALAEALPSLRGGLSSAMR